MIGKQIICKVHEGGFGGEKASGNSGWPSAADKKPEEEFGNKQAFRSVKVRGDPTNGGGAEEE